MENNTNMTDLSATAQKSLRTAGGWSMLLAVIYLLMGLLFIYSLVSLLSTPRDMLMDQQITALNTGTFALVFFLISSITMGVLFLKFSLSSMKVDGVGRQAETKQTIVNIRNLFLIGGILTVIFIIIYVILILAVRDMAGGGAF